MDNTINIVKRFKTEFWVAVFVVAIVGSGTSYMHKVQLRGLEKRANAITNFNRSQDSIKQMLFATKVNQDIIRRNQSIIMQTGDRMEFLMERHEKYVARMLSQITRNRRMLGDTVTIFHRHGLRVQE
jgi:uncharacterized protein HemX